MKETIKCLRCGTEMKYAGRHRIQLGQTGWILGDLPNLVAGAMELDILWCPDCRKVEFFAPDEDFGDGYYDDELPQKTCPKCGLKHDFDYPKCPKCGHNYL